MNLIRGVALGPADCVNFGCDAGVDVFEAVLDTGHLVRVKFRRCSQGQDVRLDSL